MLTGATAVDPRRFAGVRCMALLLGMLLLLGARAVLLGAVFFAYTLHWHDRGSPPLPRPAVAVPPLVFAAGERLAAGRRMPVAGIRVDARAVYPVRAAAARGARPVERHAAAELIRSPCRLTRVSRCRPRCGWRRGFCCWPESCCWACGFSGAADSHEYGKPALHSECGLSALLG